MFIRMTTTSEKGVMDELKILMDSGVTAMFAMPLRNYLNLCVSLGLEDIAEPETAGSMLVRQAVGIGGLTARFDGNKVLGASLLPESTWRRYRTIFLNDRAVKKKITRPMLNNIFTAIETLPEKKVFTFWKEFIDWNLIALRQGTTHIALYQITAPTGKVRTFPVVVVNVAKFYWPFSVILSKSTTFLSGASKNIHRVRDSVQGVQLAVGPTVSHTPQGVIQKFSDIMLDKGKAYGEIKCSEIFEVEFKGAFPRKSADRLVEIIQQEARAADEENRILLETDDAPRNWLDGSLQDQKREVQTNEWGIALEKNQHRVELTPLLQAQILQSEGFKEKLKGLSGIL